MAGKASIKQKGNPNPMKKAFIIAALATAAALACMPMVQARKDTTAPPAEEVLRLHIIANSDDTADQQVKLKVREAILPLIREAGGAEDERDAESVLGGLLPGIEKQAEAALAACGMPYGAHASLGTYPFPAKSYGTVLYPAGDYRALKVVLGEGKGENWWCVIFPPLCIFDAGGAPISMDAGETQVEYRSLLAELWQTIFGGQQEKPRPTNNDPE
jgi:stage II sporulation protein R